MQSFGLVFDGNPRVINQSFAVRYFLHLQTTEQFLFTTSGGTMVLLQTDMCKCANVQMNMHTREAQLHAQPHALAKDTTQALVGHWPATG